MFRRYKPFFKAASMTLLSFRFQVFAWMLVTVLQIGCLFFLWQSVYSASTGGVDSVINGFTFPEIVSYLIFVNIFGFVTFGNDTLWQINTEIKEGTIAMAFVRPISYRLRFIASNLGCTFTYMLLIGTPLFGVSFLVLSLVGFIQLPEWYMVIVFVLFFLVAQVLASMVNEAIDFIFGVLCFYTQSGWGLNFLKNTVTGFLSGSLLPIAFFPEGFGMVVNYLPFAGLGQNPVLILLMRVDVPTAIHFIGMNLVWLLIIEGIAALLFSNASKKVTVQGG